MIPFDAIGQSAIRPGPVKNVPMGVWITPCAIEQSLGREPLRTGVDVSATHEAREGRDDAGYPDSPVRHGWCPAAATRARHHGAADPPPDREILLSDSPSPSFAN